MTEDTSPENLRKFLESDDPAMVRMGLSMAKGNGIPKEMLGLVAGLYMWHDDKAVRAAAKSVFTKHAPEDLKDFVKENWKASYRTLAITNKRFLETIRLFLEAFKSQDDFALIALEPLITALVDDNDYACQSAAYVLGKIGDKHAVEPLIKALEDLREEIPYIPFRSLAADALGDIGDTRAVEPLIKALESEISPWYKASGIISHPVEALGKIGDARAVEPLIKALGNEKEQVRRDVVKALGKIGDKRAVEPLIKALEDKDSRVRESATDALGKIGDKRAVEPLIKALGDGDYEVRSNAAEALGNIGDKRAVEPLIKALEDKDSWVRKTAAEALGNIGDKRAVEPLIKALEDKDSWLRKSAASALGEIGDKRAVEPLIKALEDKDESVRNSATIALVKIARTNINGKEQDNIIKFLENDDPGMVRMGVSMLKGILKE